MSIPDRFPFDALCGFEVVSPRVLRPDRFAFEAFAKVDGNVITVRQPPNYAEAHPARCAYCGSKATGDRCQSCGAPA